MKIGVLIPDRSNTEVVDAARLAMEEANARLAAKELRFEMVVRTTEGPWGAGSKESVGLVYEDSVAAILGAVDGRNAHLAEQVAARSHVAYLETRATESTLTQAYVPWFLRCVPSDDQQSMAILRDISNRGGGSVAVLIASGYDSRMALKSFQRMEAQAGGDRARIMAIHTDSTSPALLVSQLTNSHIRHLVFTTHSSLSLEIASLVRSSLPGTEIYGTHAFSAGMDPRYPAPAPYEGMHLVADGILFSTAGQRFRSAFKERYGKFPGSAASYAYDGMRLILEAVTKAGPDRESIRDELRGIHFPGGATGAISFDALGNRKGEILFMGIEKGNPVLHEASAGPG